MKVTKELIKQTVVYNFAKAIANKHSMNNYTHYVRFDDLRPENVKIIKCELKENIIYVRYMLKLFVEVKKYEDKEKSNVMLTQKNIQAFFFDFINGVYISKGLENHFDIEELNSLYIFNQNPQNKLYLNVSFEMRGVIDKKTLDMVVKYIEEKRTN